MTLQIKLSLKMLKKKELNFNKKERKKLGNYGSVSNFDTCAKVYQNFFLEKCKLFVNSFLQGTWQLTEKAIAPTRFS